MARLVNSINEQEIKESLKNSLQSKFPGIAWQGRDSVLNSIVESVGSELIFLRREIKDRFDFNQLSNLSGELLDAAGLRMYGISRAGMATASTNYTEKNFYFYVDGRTFGDINSNNDITIPAGTIVGTSENPEEGLIFYETVEEYILDSNSSIEYCSIRAVNPGSSQNVDSESIIFHNFNGYTLGTLGYLKCTNRFPILNGADRESDSLFKIRLNNFISTEANLNVDRLTLKGLVMPGISEVRVIPSYYGIGSVGVVVFGNGRESNESIERFFNRRLYEFIGPGQDIRVSSGIKVYLDFELKVYIEKGIPILEQNRLKVSIKNDIYALIKQKENSGYISFLEVGNLVKQNIFDKRILGMGTGNGNNIFEKLYCRKTDRYNFMPENKEEIIGNELSLEADERLGFGIVNIVFEERD